MCQFVETISIRSAKPQLLDWHQRRLNKTFNSFYPKSTPHQIAEKLTDPPHGESIKCRFLYDAHKSQIEYTDYIVKPIESLQIVRDDQVDYEFKTVNRSYLESVFDKRRLADDIIIIKDGFVTDSYYANLVFYDGARWYTPDSPLLGGVKRQYLLNTGEIYVKKIMEGDLLNYEKVSLINAMLDLGQIELSVNQIIF